MQIFTDYLQVFNISPVEIDNQKKLKIVHSQESPEYKNEETTVVLKMEWKQTSKQFMQKHFTENELSMLVRKIPPIVTGCCLWQLIRKTCFSPPKQRHPRQAQDRP